MMKKVTQSKKPVSMLILLLLLAPGAYSKKIKKSFTPEPNMVEKEYIELEIAAEVSEDLGNGEYLFKPVDLTLGDDDSLFVFDAAQVKILKFDKYLKFVKSFARKGVGPGEIHDSGFGHHYYIKFGLDGLLYGHDDMRQIVHIFDKQGRFIRQFHVADSDFRNTFRRLTVDKSGAFLMPNLKNGELNLYNEKFKIAIKVAKETRLEKHLFIAPKFDLKIFSSLVAADVTIDSQVLVYFRNSSELFVFKNGKKIKELDIWPKSALDDYEIAFKLLMEKDHPAYAPMFGQLFTDGADASKFYLQYGRTHVLKGIRALYQFDLNNNPVKVFFVRAGNDFPNFYAAKHDRFYSICVNRNGEYKVIIYRPRRNLSK